MNKDRRSGTLSILNRASPGGKAIRSTFRCLPTSPPIGVASFVSRSSTRAIPAGLPVSCPLRPVRGVTAFISEILASASEGAGSAGTVIVEDASPEAKGRLCRAGSNPRRLEWENGDECFLLGFECDWLATLDLEARTGAKARTLIKSVKENGFNHVVMNVYAHEVPWGGVLGRNSKYDFSAPKSWPFGGDNDHPDYDTLNTAYFDNLDSVVAALREEGIICHLMIYVWNKAVNWPEQNSSCGQSVL